MDAVNYDTDRWLAKWHFHILNSRNVYTYSLTVDLNISNCTVS